MQQRAAAREHRVEHDHRTSGQRRRQRGHVRRRRVSSSRPKPDEAHPRLGQQVDRPLGHAQTGRGSKAVYSGGFAIAVPVVVALLESRRRRLQCSERRGWPRRRAVWPVLTARRGNSASPLFRVVHYQARTSRACTIGCSITAARVHGTQNPRSEYGYPCGQPPALTHAGLRPPPLSINFLAGRRGVRHQRAAPADQRGDPHRVRLNRRPAARPHLDHLGAAAKPQLRLRARAARTQPRPPAPPAYYPAGAPPDALAHGRPPARPPPGS